MTIKEIRDNIISSLGVPKKYIFPHENILPATLESGDIYLIREHSILNGYYYIITNKVVYDDSVKYEYISIAPDGSKNKHNVSSTLLDVYINSDILVKINKPEEKAKVLLLL